METSSTQTIAGFSESEIMNTPMMLSQSGGRIQLMVKHERYRNQLMTYLRQFKAEYDEFVSHAHSTNS